MREVDWVRGDDESQAPQRLNIPADSKIFQEKKRDTG